MSHSHKEYLLHILEETNFVLTSTQNTTQEEFDNDAILKRAVVRSLEIVGEAAKKLPDDFKVQHPETDWKAMAGTRDKLIHDYFGVDYDIVWDIVINELPLLKEQLANMLDTEQ